MSSRLNTRARLVGLLIVAPAIAVALLVWSMAGWLARRRREREPSHRIGAAIVAGVVCYLVIGALVVHKDPFPARVCLLNGRGVDGVFVG